MNLTLLTFFDLGESYGLGDDSFVMDASDADATRADLGIRNPYGHGFAINALSRSPSLAPAWFDVAIALVDVMDEDILLVDPGTAGASLESVRDELRALLKKLRFVQLEIRMYAVGVATVRVDLGGRIPLAHVHGVMRCVEFAGYDRRVSDSLHALAISELCLRDAKSLRELRTITKRHAAETRPVVDSATRQESSLLTFFTPLVTLDDARDDLNEVHAATGLMAGDTEIHSATRIPFGSWGVLHFRWSGCVIDSRKHGAATTSWQEAQAIIHLIEVAHTMLAVSTAFDQFTKDALKEQVESHVRKGEFGRNTRQLSQLRTFTSAVLSLNDPLWISASEESQAYLSAFEKYAKLEHRQQRVRERIEVIHTVQSELERDQETKRQNILNAVVAFLTGFTLVSVFTDSYGFLRGENQELLGMLDSRGFALVSVGALVLTLIAILLRLVLRR